MTGLEKTIASFRSLIPQAEIVNASVSHWSVGRHLYHCCLAMKGVCRSLKNSVPPKPSAKFVPIKFIVFLTGRIPRGKGKAPEAAMPPEKIAQAEVSALLDEVEQLLAETINLEPQRWFKHHVFGVLSLDEAFRFFVVHNKHHLRIIRDILT